MINMKDIEEKFDRLSPAGQDMVMAFVDFLLFRENDDVSARWEEEDLPGVNQPFTQETGITAQKQEGGQGSGIILAEERDLTESDDAIDFADINTRFSQKEQEGEKQGPIRQRKMFDWL